MFAPIVREVEHVLLVLGSLVSIALVLALELVNSSLESISRAITDQYNEYVGKALNIASAAVLLSALLSAVVGLLILGPKLIEWLGSR